jgi:hypothetical protein
VIEYVGEVVTKEEFHSRRAAYAKNNEPHFYFLELSAHHFIDAKSKGNNSRCEQATSPIFDFDAHFYYA